MEKISIICLIYQSTSYAEFVYNNLLRYTRELHNGDAEFYFVANDATPEVLDFLKQKNYPHFVNNNKHYTEAELFTMGYAYPEYINRVYAGYNFGIKQSKNQILVLINSDNCFSPDWLYNLKKRLTHNTAVSPKIIQPTWFQNPLNGTYCEIIDFGTTISSFKESEFIKMTELRKVDTETIGVALMPLMIYKENIEKVGYYPEGNLHNGSYKVIKRTGDTEFFLKLQSIGVNHITSNDSIVYHFNEGEKHKKC